MLSSLDTRTQCPGNDGERGHRHKDTRNIDQYKEISGLSVYPRCPKSVKNVPQRAKEKNLIPKIKQEYIPYAVIINMGGPGFQSELWK